VADALSRVEGQNEELITLPGELLAFSEITPQWVLDVIKSYTNDPWIEGLQIKLASQGDHYLFMHQILIRYKGKICVGATNNWRQILLHEVHDSATGGFID
jgi:hypothetical protein